MWWSACWNGCHKVASKCKEKKVRSGESGEGEIVKGKGCGYGVVVARLRVRFAGRRESHAWRGVLLDQNPGAAPEGLALGWDEMPFQRRGGGFRGGLG